MLFHDVEFFLLLFKPYDSSSNLNKSYLGYDFLMKTFMNHLLQNTPYWEIPYFFSNVLITNMQDFFHYFIVTLFDYYTETYISVMF